MVHHNTCGPSQDWARRVRPQHRPLRTCACSDTEVPKVEQCHETTARGATLLESVVLDVELCTILGLRLDLVKPVCGVPVVSSRLLLVEYSCPKTETDIRGSASSNVEL